MNEINIENKCVNNHGMIRILTTRASTLLYFSAIPKSHNFTIGNCANNAASE
jgi:hypothetical protein